MATHTFILQLECGGRTETKVRCSPKSINEKLLVFKGKKQTLKNRNFAEQVANVIQKQLENGLQ